MDTIFTRILKKEIPGEIVAETEEFFAILDIFPVQKGHTLVIPKQEVDYLFDLQEDLYQRYMLFVKDMADVLKEVTGCVRVGVKVEGMEVPHCHVHLIPMNKPQDFTGKVTVSTEQMTKIAGKIRSAFARKS
jgi:histidine triad (HIT) family protein